MQRSFKCWLCAASCERHPKGKIYVRRALCFLCFTWVDKRVLIALNKKQFAARASAIKQILREVAAGDDDADMSDFRLGLRALLASVEASRVVIRDARVLWLGRFTRFAPRDDLHRALGVATSTNPAVRMHLLRLRARADGSFGLFVGGSGEEEGGGGVVYALKDLSGNLFSCFPPSSSLPRDLVHLVHFLDHPCICCSDLFWGWAGCV